MHQSKRKDSFAYSEDKWGKCTFALCHINDKHFTEGIHIFAVVVFYSDRRRTPHPTGSRKDTYYKDRRPKEQHLQEILYGRNNK